MTLKPILLAALAALLPSIGSAQQIAPKVVVITMFSNETAPWLDNLDLPEKIAVPGLSEAAPDLSCNADLCVMTTQMGFANAASSAAAVALSDKLDLTQTYFIIAGIAGIDPHYGTLGSAVWVDYEIDGGLYNRIGADEIPPDWTSTIVEMGTPEPGVKPDRLAGSEIWRINPALVVRAVSVTKGVELADGDDARSYRALYLPEAAKAPPAVLSCSSVSADTYWHGAQIATELADHASLLTDGAAQYCVTQMEDNATLTALHRAANAGKLDFDRVAALRTASNFDRPHAGQTAIESLRGQSGGFGPAIANAFRVGNALAQDIIANWDEYKDGVPK